MKEEVVQRRKMWTKERGTKERECKKVCMKRSEKKKRQN